MNDASSRCSMVISEDGQACACASHRCGARRWIFVRVGLNAAEPALGKSTATQPCRSLSDSMTLSWWVRVRALIAARPSIASVFFPPLLLHSFLPSPTSGLPWIFIYNGLYFAIEHSRPARCACYSSAVLRLHWLPQLLDRQDPGSRHPPEPSEQPLIHQL